MIWVVDASVAVRWFLANEIHPHAEAVLEHLVYRPESFAVPELFCFEVFSVLCRVHSRGPEAFLEGVIPLLEGGMFRHPMTTSLASQAERFIALGLTGYDACYVALAQTLQGVWLTFDARAHRALAATGLSCDLNQELPPDWRV